MQITDLFSILAAVAATIASVFAALMYRERRKYEKQSKEIKDQQEKVLQQMSEFSTQLMTQTLKVAPQYAFSPYQQLLSPVSPDDHSLFDRRCSHFGPEKSLLAECVVNEIQDSMDPDISRENGKLSVILILDAGSTVFPIFRKLCLHPFFKFDRNNARRLKIITNNLPGVSELIKYGRIGDPIRAATLFKCQILSGYAHSQYEASLSQDTPIDVADAVEKFRGQILESRQTDSIKVISVVTGNYASINDGILARDGNHIFTKNAMINVSDFTYVVAPLGKWLPYSRDEINNLLNYQGDEKVSYGTLQDWEQNLQKITVVATTRRSDYFLEIRPAALGVHLGRVQAEIAARYKNHMIPVPFDPLDDVPIRVQGSLMGMPRALREYEFPHKNLRQSLVARLEKY